MTVLGGRPTILGGYGGPYCCKVGQWHFKFEEVSHLFSGVPCWGGVMGHELWPLVDTPCKVSLSHYYNNEAVRILWWLQKFAWGKKISFCHSSGVLTLPWLFIKSLYLSIKALYLYFCTIYWCFLVNLNCMTLTIKRQVILSIKCLLDCLTYNDYVFLWIIISN